MSENYFILNKETGKLELHFEKSTYAALTDAQKSEIKSNFLWGRRSGCWISRAKEPNLYYARKVAESIGLEDAGTEGERLSFAEQQARKQERAERRADRYEGRAEAAERKGERLQAPINAMHEKGDTAFFTQPNIDSAAGRAFTRRREKMFAAYEKGFDELRRSEYWKERAATARTTAAAKELQDKGFIMRRIKERESGIRKVGGRIKEYESYLETIAAGGEPRDKYGWAVTLSPEDLQKQIDADTERLEVLLDELGYYQEALDNLGGVQFSAENVKPGYRVDIQKYGPGEVISCGPKNVMVKFIGGSVFACAYAEIKSVTPCERAPETHPFKVGESFTCRRWNKEKRVFEEVTFKIIRATEKSVTLQTGDEKPFVRKPIKRPWSGNWYIGVTEWNDGTWYKSPEKAAEQPAAEPAAELDPEEADAMTPEQFAEQAAQQ